MFSRAGRGRALAGSCRQGGAQASQLRCATARMEAHGTRAGLVHTAQEEARCTFYEVPSRVCACDGGRMCLRFEFGGAERREDARAQQTTWCVVHARHRLAAPRHVLPVGLSPSTQRRPRARPSVQQDWQIRLEPMRCIKAGGDPGFVIKRSRSPLSKFYNPSRWGEENAPPRWTPDTGNTQTCRAWSSEGPHTLHCRALQGRPRPSARPDRPQLPPRFTWGMAAGVAGRRRRGGAVTSTACRS